MSSPSRQSSHHFGSVRRNGSGRVLVGPLMVVLSGCGGGLNPGADSLMVHDTQLPDVGAVEPDAATTEPDAGDGPDSGDEPDAETTIPDAGLAADAGHLPDADAGEQPPPPLSPRVNGVPLDNCRPRVGFSEPTTHHWITAGQSNAQMQQIFPTFEREITRRFPNLTLDRTGHARQGNEIERWDVGDAGWEDLTSRITRHADRAGVAVEDMNFVGFIWYQGESNTFDPEHRKGDPNDYDVRLADLVSRVREFVSKPELSVIVIQLGNNTRASKAKNLSIVRENQVRFVDSDPYARVIPVNDSPTGDGVHLTPEGRAMAGRRAGIAALGLTYGLACASSPGLRLHRQSFEDETRRTVRVEFSQVYGSVQVDPAGWEWAFGVLEGGVPWRSDGRPPHSDTLSFEPEDLTYPALIEAAGPAAVRLHFDQALPAGAHLGWAMAGSSGLGRTADRNEPFTGIYDEEGFPPLAWLARPIEPAP